MTASSPYFHYVVLAYAVFFVVLAWDVIVPHMQVRKQLRDARNRLARANRQAAASTSANNDGELSR